MPKYHMHKKEREITEKTQLTDILKRGKFATISLCRNSEPYLVTLNYGYDESHDCLYFHTTLQGLKIDFLQSNNNACGTVIEDLGYVNGKCSHKYRSVVFWGKIVIVEDLERKKQGMNILLGHLEKNPDTVRKTHLSEDALYQRVAILRLDMSEITGKQSL